MQFERTGRIAELRKLTSATLARWRAAGATIKQEKDTDAPGKLAAALEAQSLIQEVAAAIQTKAHAQITAVVTRCLADVFPGRGYAFEIEFARKRGKTEARMAYRKHGILIDPVEEDSGGVLQVAAFALRAACLMLKTPRQRKLLVLDEAFAAVSAEFVPNVAELLLALSRELGIQFILSTHSPKLKVGRVVEVGG
jgi:ABC-type glutathione transport system ATPase component